MVQTRAQGSPVRGTAPPGGPRVDHPADQLHQRLEHQGELAVAGGDAPELLEVGEGVFHQVS